MIRYCHEISHASWISNYGIFLFHSFPILVFFARERSIHTYFLMELCDVPFRFNVLCFWLYILPIFHTFFHMCALLFFYTPLGLLVWPLSCDQHSFSCMFLMFTVRLCCICATNSNSCCYTSYPSYPLFTAFFPYCLMHMVALSCWFSRRLVAFLPQPLGCIIRLEKL